MTTIAYYDGRLYTDSRCYSSGNTPFYQIEDVPGKAHLLYNVGGFPMALYAFAGDQMLEAEEIVFEEALLRHLLNDTLTTFDLTAFPKLCSELILVTKKHVYIAYRRKTLNEIAQKTFSALGSGRNEAYAGFLSGHPLNELMAYVSETDDLTSCDTYIYDSSKLFDLEKTK